MQTAKQTTGIVKVYGAITVDKVGPSLNSKKAQAQLRQTVTNVYPGVRPGNSLNDGLFTAEEFGSETQEFIEERVAFVPVPLTATLEDVQKRISALPKARITRILSLKPILTKEQENAMVQGLSKNEDGSPKTMEDYENSQHILNKAKEKVLYQGKYPQYRVTSFLDGNSSEPQDLDFREEDLLDLYPLQMSADQLLATTARGARKAF